MAAIVGIVSQKGGTRKSTIARALAVAYTKAQWVTRIADMDSNQSTSTNWNNRRQARGQLPALDVQKYRQASAAINDSEALDMLIIDGRPLASDETAVIAKASDLVLIPTGTGLDDLEPSIIVALALVNDHGIDPARIAFPLTNMGDSQAEVTAANAYLEEAGFTALDGHLTIKTSYSQAHDLGRAVTEALSRGPKKRANDLIQAIIDRIERLTDQ